MFAEMLENVRKQAPLIHCITNYVTVNDVANMVLAVGASPIMADDAKEVEEITSICQGLTVNIGTLNERTISSMLLAGKKANMLGHKVLLDPVGAGASRLRTDTANILKKEVHFDVIRGNISEIKTLADGSKTTSGVDANKLDKVTKDNLKESIAFAKSFAEETGSVIAITGEIDLVTDGKKCFVLTNGTKFMSSITGTGCQLSALATAFISANPTETLLAAATAVGAMGLAGEIAFSKLSEGEGNATYRNYIIDAVCGMNPERLEKGYAMKSIKDDLLLYAVTDKSWLKEGETIYQKVKEALQGGVTMVQLREKNLKAETFLQEAELLKKVCESEHVPLIINDSIEIAKKVDADGVHLGQSDESAFRAREILGKDKIIGISVHTCEEAQKAQEMGADYLGVGAVFQTGTKADAVDVSLDVLKEITQKVTIPVVAIGGISMNNIKELKGSKIAGVAVISAIFAHQDVRKSAASLRKEAESICKTFCL